MGDARRQSVGGGLFKVFLTMQRYEDLLRIRPARQWLDAIESALRLEQTQREQAQSAARGNQEAYDERRRMQDLAKIRAEEARRKAVASESALGAEERAGTGNLASTRDEEEQGATGGPQEMLEERRRMQDLARTRAAEARRKSTVSEAVIGAEVLAGAGDLASARELATKLLAFDPSEETRALLRKHLERAGQPELLAQP